MLRQRRQANAIRQRQLRELLDGPPEQVEEPEKPPDGEDAVEQLPAEP
ncbi:hypothetical protein [Actinophytocola oryzae]|uniref:Uncharacterized protein n=1 Tax=Actinophytocola oryzae TaxID=502181 RepID=A0A4R7W0M4_9PSEU|nr:hypothetical protein [Actinophytocola oryzae]TDV55077.1 hypothetical protein CLV71_103318 [Actinophytocola oryzae]